MKTFIVPKSMQEAFGEQQTWFEAGITLLFAIVVTLVVYFFQFDRQGDIAIWAQILGFVIVADIVAGCVANFTRGTNNYYAQRPRHRWNFIAIHFHLPIVAWLLGGDLRGALLVWGYTIATAVLVNLLRGKPQQLFVAATLLCGGMLLVVHLDFPLWLCTTSLFFVTKVMFSFAVEHYHRN